MPLCMGIAIASGLPPEKGLRTGIIGGLVVGRIAGSPLQVSGPAAGLAVIVFELVSTQGVGALGPNLLIAGAVQLSGGGMKRGCGRSEGGRGGKGWGCTGRFRWGAVHEETNEKQD